MNQNRNNIENLSNEESFNVDIKQYYYVLLKKKWLVLFVLVAAGLIGSIQNFTAIPLYNATCRILIEKDRPNIFTFQNIFDSNTNSFDYYQTQYKLLESKTIAKKVILKLKLHESDEFYPPKNNIVFITNTKKYIIDLVSSINKKLNVQERSNSKKITNKISNNVTVDDKVEIPDWMVNSFISHVAIIPVMNSRLVDLHYRSSDPVIAAKIVNTLAEIFIEHNLDVRLQSIQNTMQWLNNKISSERKRVEYAENNLHKFKEKFSIVTGFTGEVTNVAAQRIADFNTQIIQAESERLTAQTKYRQAMDLKSQGKIADSITEVINNPTIQEIKKSKVELSVKISELSKKYGDNHPKIKSVEAELSSLNKQLSYEIDQILSSLRNQYEILLVRERSLKDSLNVMKKEALSTNKIALEYEMLKREVDSAREMYNLMIQRFKETSVTEDIKTSNVRIIDIATVPASPVWPQKSKNIRLWLLVGLIGGVAVAFIVEFLDNTIKTPQDIEKFLKLPFLGIIPNFRKKESKSDSKYVECITFTDVKSAASESYRSIRTRILFSSPSHPPKTIIVTSSVAGEGKTINSANLAVTMAQSGSRVLLIDSDLRRPRLHKVFHLGRDKGLTNVVVGNCSPQDVIFPTEVKNLYFMPSGPIPPNPSELIGSEKMHTLLGEFENNFDRIIFDTPPLSAVTDAALLAKYVDGVILIIRGHSTSKDAIRSGVANLHAINAHIIGCIVNGIDLEKSAYYYQYYYSYYYGEHDSDNNKKIRKKRRVSGKQKELESTMDINL